VVAGVPWARHDSLFTAAFEEQAAWLAAHATATMVAVLMRSSWRAVTRMVTRVVGQARGKTDRLEGLVRIAIDEKAYRKGHRYITVVTDVDTGRVVWAAEGRSQATVEAFFAALGTERAAALTHVGCDGADWIHPVVKVKAPNAVLCLDSFHVVAWAGEAVDEVRRRVTRDLKADGRDEEAKALKGSRWAVLKNPRNLSGGQQESLAVIRKTNGPLYRAYLIKEQLREVFRVKGIRGRRLLAGVIAWASRSRIPEMVDLARKLRRFHDPIGNTLDTGVTSALAENTNTHISVLARRAYGFHSPEALIAMIELTRGGLCPPLPGRAG